ncbi:MAG: hypothetical protein M3Y72_04350 [Acidobacteriota bacterium]|nr:hypothetical protein [Acidobacteriota bacterium]
MNSFWRQHFERNATVEQHVKSAKDNAHTTASYLFLDTIAASNQIALSEKAIVQIA